MQTPVSGTVDELGASSSEVTDHLVDPTKGLISGRKQPQGPPLEQGAPPNASRNTPFIGNIIEPCNVAVLELLNALVGPLVPICERKQSLPAIEAAANLKW